MPPNSNKHGDAQRPRGHGGPKVYGTPAFGSPWGERRYAADVDWSRYATRVGELLTLHEKDGVREVFELASNIYGVSPIILAQWATNEKMLGEHPPDDPMLARMLAYIQGVFEQKRHERGDLTWIDLLEEYVPMVPRIEVSYNWAPYDTNVRKQMHERTGAEAFSSCTTTEVKSDHEPALPVGIPAFVTLRIPVSPMKVWGLEKIVDAVSTVIRDALNHCPSQEEAPGMMGTIPPRREVLMNAHDSVLNRDIERYKRYMSEGLTFRQVAFVESLETSGKSVDLKDLPGKIRIDVPKESAVCESVTRIYEAIYLKSFPHAKRRRLDTPAQGVALYNCPTHGGDCPRDCQYMWDWLTKVERTLPTDLTGSGDERRIASAKPRARPLRRIGPRNTSA